MTSFILTPANVKACKKILKTLYIILVDLVKIYHKNERDLRLVTHILTKLSLNVCLINTHTF